ncbi:glycosyltransferase [Aerococcaceae bacterium DSM 111020]|nr:glycosyltransferase [Aerococcaceae bacterium DSM 111020]
MSEMDATSYSPMRVLHIMSGFGGGISSFIMNKAKEMSKFNIIFDVVTYDECSPAFIEAIGTTGGSVYLLSNPKTTNWKTFKESFKKPLQDHEYDLVQCHIDGYRALAYYFLLPAHLKKCFYIHAHQSYSPPTSLFEQLKTKFDQLINRSLSNSYLGCGYDAIKGVYGNAVSVNEMMMIPNSIDPKRFSMTSDERQQLRKAFREQFGYTETDLVVVQASRFEAVKNHQFTLKLASYLKQEGIKMQFIFFGHGNLEEAIRREISENQLEDYVQLHDYEKQIERVYAGADVVFLPSLYEGLPTVVVESQAAGIPVVMSDTITDEVDLDLGMVKVVSLEAPLIEWYTAIQEMAQADLLPQDERINHLAYNNFTNRASAVIYAQFIHGERNHYLIKEDN